MSARKLDAPEKRLCPCGGEELTDWRPVGPRCFNSADMEDRKELLLKGKRTSRATVKRLAAHAASRANEETLNRSRQGERR